MSEFELIEQYFFAQQPAVPHIALGIGDDCALLAARSGMQLAISSDMLVEGRHFFAGADPELLGHKALAVNLSDLAAMGAEPRGLTLALALPHAEAAWLQGFSRGLFALANQFDCTLIGGDTTRGPLNICITVIGEVPVGQALRRDAARVGDDLWVSGSLGDARLALAGCLQPGLLPDDAQQRAAQRLHKPTPRVVLGLALRSIAHAAIDLSDGLLGDLAHILQRSQVGACLWCDAVPVGAILATQAQALQYHYALAGGDDYELCFTASAASRQAVLDAAAAAATPVTRIGCIEAAPGLRIVDQHHTERHFAFKSFDHFDV